jgi:hypothetical protein
VVGALTSPEPSLSAAVIGPDAPATEPDVAAAPKRARSVATWVVPLGYLLAALLLTARLWVDPAGRVVVGNPHDADLIAWFMRYTATALRHGRLPALVTTGMNAPIGINLMWNTAMFLPGILLAPVTGLAGPQVSLTIMTTIGFAGSASALFWVLRRWDVSTPAAALAGAVYGFSPALLQTALSHYDLQLAILPPLIVSACARLAVGPRVPACAPTWAPVRWLARVPAWARTGVWLGLLVAGQIFVMEEIALTTAMAAVLIVLVLAVSRPRTALRRLAPTAAGLVVAVAISLVLAGHALWVQFHGPLALHGSSHPLDVFENDLTSFVTPQGALLFHTAASAAAAAHYHGGLPEYLGYLGWPLIGALAVAAVVSWRRLAARANAVTLVLLCLFSLGGAPLIAGKYYRATDLPWHWIEQVPVFAPILTDRISIVADGAAATLLAIGIDEARRRLAAHWPARLAARWPARWGEMAVLGVAVLCCLPLLPRPLPVETVVPLPTGWSTVFARLHLAPDTNVLILPYPRPSETLALRWVADSGEPSAMTGGYFVGPGIDGRARLGPQVLRRVPEYLDYLWAKGVPASSLYAGEAEIAVGEWTSVRHHGWVPPRGPVTLAEMASWRPQVIVADAKASSPLGKFLIKLLGPPSLGVGDLIAWRHPVLTGYQAPPGSSLLLGTPRLLLMQPTATAADPTTQPRTTTDSPKPR